MGRKLDDIPVYTKESVITTDDDEKKQAVIDEWTDELALKMAGKAECFMDEDGSVKFKRKTRQGGHNRQTIEMLNVEGYVVRVFHSITETSMYFGIHPEVITRTLNGQRKTPIKPGYILRRLETTSERRQREKTIKKANKTREKTIKKKKNYGKTRKKTD
jgi:hypothetical protein